MCWITQTFEFSFPTFQNYFKQSLPLKKYINMLGIRDKKLFINTLNHYWPFFTDIFILIGELIKLSSFKILNSAKPINNKCPSFPRVAFYFLNYSYIIPCLHLDQMVRIKNRMLCIAILIKIIFMIIEYINWSYQKVTSFYFLWNLRALNCFYRGILRKDYHFWIWFNANGFDV